MPKICFLGSGLSWTPGIAIDVMSVFEKEPLDFFLVDINHDNAIFCKNWLDKYIKHANRNDTVTVCKNRSEGLKDADAVIIAVSTGGLDAMANDLLIPEKYGIYPTVGDTCGPSGFSRAIRNIPVFEEFASDFQKLCPNAIIINYTNPMAALTAVLQKRCDNPVIGLCHAYFETKDVIQKLFDLEDWSQISLSIAGMNHFTWIVDFNIGTKNGYKLLRKKIGNESLLSFLPSESKDEIGWVSGHFFCAELFDAYGYLPYPGDRHTCEFFSFTLSGKNGHPPRRQTVDKNGNPQEAIDYCTLKRTDIEQRKKNFPQHKKHLLDIMQGKQPWPPRSREKGADMIRAYLRNQPLVDAVNCLNTGQIPDLPLDCCVETLGLVNGLGVSPVLVNNVPEHILELIRIQAVCQKWIVQGSLDRNVDKLFQALYHDAQCAHLRPDEIRKMADEIFAANKKWISL